MLWVLYFINMFLKKKLVNRFYLKKIKSMPSSNNPSYLAIDHRIYFQKFYDLKLNWWVIGKYNSIYLKFTMCWFDIHMHCGMITKIKITNKSITSKSYLFVCVCVVRMLRFNVNNFQVHSIVWLTLVTLLYNSYSSYNLNICILWSMCVLCA